MALSNWDTLAVDENSKSTNGVFESALGVTVEIYKNWLYVRDPKAWQEGGAFVEPTIMEVHDGSFRYKDVQIVAKRGPKTGVYAVVWTQTFPDVPSTAEKDCEDCGAKAGEAHNSSCKTYGEPSWKIMAGIGCYGYEGDEFVGVDVAEIEFLRAMIDESESETWDIPGPGDEKKTQTFTHYSFEEKIRAINLDEALRFNQGDAYFAGHCDEPPPATPPGVAEKTVMHSLIEAMKDGKTGA
jgi:hypothetical protein